MANVFNVARYILDKCGSMSTWKLQKLCYYSQAWSLAWTGNPIFTEDFEAWANGPVCPELFRKHRGLYTASVSDIPAKQESNPPLDDKQRDIIDLIIEDYGKMEPDELREQSHSERPWLAARGNLSDGARCQTVISKNEMIEYYGSLYKGCQTMGQDMIVSRPCPIAESIIGSMHEVALMRAGKIKKPTLDDLFKNIEMWSKEDNVDVRNNPDETFSD